MMPISKNTRTVLRNLAELIVREPEGSSKGTLLSSFKSGVIPQHLRRSEDETLLISDEDHRAYKTALVRLGEEPELEHLAARDIDNQLWSWVCELFVRRADYQTAGARAKEITRLVVSLRRPWQQYEVLATIDNLTLRVKQLEVAGVNFRHLTATAAATWGLTGSVPMDQFSKDVVGHCIAFTKVAAGSEHRAAEKARLKIDDALDTLRAVLTASILDRFSAQSLRFTRGQQLAVRSSTSSRVSLLSWQRGRLPETFHVTGPTARPVRQHLEPINQFLEQQALSEKLRSRVLRALHWIGQGITKESPDDRVINFCTALETLLTTKMDPRKGEAIALRTMLLGEALQEGFLHPTIVYELYEIRSEIVHGSAVRVATARDSDQLLWLANQMTTFFVRHVTKNPSVTTHSKFIKSLEEEERVRAAVGWFGSSSHPAMKNIASYARGLLK